jgi:hypothetical protein
VSLVAFSLVAAFPTRAFAYLDPGTGSFILQAAIAGVMGAVFTIKLYWSRIKAKLRGETPKEEDPGHDGPE